MKLKDIILGLYPATLTVLNADGDSLQNITLANYKFVHQKMEPTTYTTFA